ncbi:MAG: DUF3465 domain-containing protein [Candidatus Eremiobacteraeota bacterium]|nr:DUF3465 domain-containing protein [Candidatus Eremiobacteraeota bacterium]
MKWLKAAALLVLGACSPNAAQSDDLSGAQAACTRGAQHAEVTIGGTVARVLGVRHGRNGSHEGFTLRMQATAPTLHIEDNIDITGYIPMHPGDTVELMGQYECNDGVIHWTHHDPRGRHPSGYIKINGRAYQ